MRLLLDEHFATAIAEQLRARGHDAVAIPEIPGLRGLPDDRVMREAQAQARGIVTENVADFAVLDREYRAGGRLHHGLVFTSNHAFPRGRPETIGRLVQALAALLAEHPGCDVDSRVVWLGPPEP